MAKKQSPPLTEDEIRSTYRNEFYEIDSGRYYKHKCTGSKRYYRIISMSDTPISDYNRAIEKFKRHFRIKD